MEILTNILILLVLVLITNIISHYISFLPTALIQIGMGLVFSVLMKDFKIEVETEWFLLLFIAPLLYYDGAHFPREQLWKMRASILGNAIFLVLLTTIVGGYVIHWMVPSIPLAAAFALAAILSPTDPIAVNGIAKRIRIPNHIMNLVRGESLINDASGLVAFNYAVAAVVTGYFSLKEATGDFFYMFFVGALLGVILGISMNVIRYALRDNGINDVIFHALLQILTPFIIFFIAEELLHASGVVAVVAAGIIYALVKEKTENLIAQEQILTDGIWMIMIFTLNGVIFLLLGLTLPSAMHTLIANDQINNWRLLGYVVALGTFVLGIRFVWTLVFNSITYYVMKNQENDLPSMKNAIITSLVGVRGTITMIGVLSLPFFTESNEIFPMRSLIIFLAAGVILFTLLVATIFLPLLSEKDNSPNLKNLNIQKQRMITGAIQRLKQERSEENTEVVYELINEYVMMLHLLKSKMKDEQQLQKYNDQLKEERIKALRMERIYLEEYCSFEDVPVLLIKQMHQSISERERAVITGSSHIVSRKLKQVMQNWRRSYLEGHEQEALSNTELNMHFYIFSKVLEQLNQQIKTESNPEILQHVIYYYKRLVRKFEYDSDRDNSGELTEAQEVLCTYAIEGQRKAISQMLLKEEVTQVEAKELRRFVNYMESVVLFEYVE